MAAAPTVTVGLVIGAMRTELTGEQLQSAGATVS